MATSIRTATLHRRRSSADAGTQIARRGKNGFNLKEEGHNGCCTTTAYVLSHEQVSQHNLSVDAPHYLIVSTLQKSCIAEAALEQQAILLERAWNTAGGESLPQSVVLSKIGLYLI